jgi:phosphatidylglycerol:prolipoprotein diacylglycerol transferase
LPHALVLTLPSPSSPILFEAGPFAVRYYGLFIALGIGLGVWVTARELARKGYDSTVALDALYFVVPLGFIGARLYHVATDFELYANDPFPGIFEVWNGGLGIYGAVIGGFVGGILFAWIRGINPLVLADAVAPGLVLAQAVGRWGNYFNQELFGRPSSLPWAIDIDPQNRPAGYKDVASFHPTFLYESVWDLLVAFVLLLVARRFSNRLKNGDVFLLYVSLYSTGRFFVETLRIDRAFLIGDFRGNLFVASVLAITFALILFLRHAGAGRAAPRKRSTSE